MKLKNKIVLFDLDKTLISCDSLKQLLLFLLRRDFYKFYFKIPFLIKISLLHFFSGCDHRTKTKSKFFSKILEGYSKEQINKFSKEFANLIFLNFKNKKIYKKLINLKKIGDKVYIVTASADFYCKFIAKLFKAKLISTKVNLNKKEFGNIIGKNCFGKEKKKRVLKEIKNFKKKYSILYTDSKTDIPLLKICKKGYII